MDLCKDTRTPQDGIQCSNCKNYISGSLENGEWFCRKKAISEFPFGTIEKCYEEAEN
jgi:hypothetical protein